MISIISFTENGLKLALTIKQNIENEIMDSVSCYVKMKAVSEAIIVSSDISVSEWARERLSNKDTLIFVGATGIAVRAIAPSIQNKLTDSPVICVDELGNFVIPLIGGHYAGANELACKISDLIGATPVITTATDINNKWAVDVWAKKNGFNILNKDGIAKVSSKVLRDEDVTIHIGEAEEFYDIVVLDDTSNDKCVATSDGIESKCAIPGNASLYLKPKKYILGIGCKRDKEYEVISQFVNQVLAEHNISCDDIFKIASIDRKKDEVGIIKLAESMNVPFVTFSDDELMSVAGEFETSEFVLKTVGVDNVCERAAVRACDDEDNSVKETSNTYRKIVGKTKGDGVTVAIYERDWRACIYEL